MKNLKIKSIFKMNFWVKLGRIKKIFFTCNPNHVFNAHFNKYTFIIAISTLIIFSLILFTSCNTLLPSPDEKIDVGSSLDSKESEITQPKQDDSLPLEEDTEIVEEINIANAKIGAEIIGYIPSFLCANSDNYITITIKNTSDFTWRNKKPSAVRVGYHYFGQDVDYADYDRTTRTELPKSLEPNEQMDIDVLINDITNPGHYIIQIDLVMEGSDNPDNNFWFSSKGIEMIEGLTFFDQCQNKE